MKKLVLLSLICFTSIAFAFTGWAAGRGGGGGFHGGGFGGGHFGGGGPRFGGGGHFGGGGPRFGGGGHFGGGGPRFGGGGHFGGGFQHFGAGGARFSPSGARQSQVRPHAIFAPNRRIPTQSAPTAGTLNRRPDRRTTNQAAPSNIARNRGAMHPPAARPSRTFPQRGLNGRRDHIFARHEGNWQRGWDRHHPHFHRGHFFVFDDGFWFGLDAGVFPWDYLPYYDSDYDPYNYYTDGQPDGNTASINNGVPVADPTVQAVQTRLAQLGYYAGPVDGIFGALTRDAVAKYQIARQLTVTGSLSPDTLQSLGLSQATQG